MEKIMRVTELVELGYDRATLVRWMDEPDFPKIKLGLNQKSPWGIPVKSFKKWQEKHGMLHGDIKKDDS
ncbi:hypothetical protein A4S06_05210 [Erysipelotrichaceae bacterium MTC7]|nr:hypothetical protein A4S06_05210 [Erysipelotrichaceae bacterium MTC7]